MRGFPANSRTVIRRRPARLIDAERARIGREAAARGAYERACAEIAGFSFHDDDRIVTTQAELEHHLAHPPQHNVRRLYLHGGTFRGPAATGNFSLIALEGTTIEGLGPHLYYAFPGGRVVARAGDACARGDGKVVALDKTRRVDICDQGTLERCQAAEAIVTVCDNAVGVIEMAAQVTVRDEAEVEVLGPFETTILDRGTVLSASNGAKICCRSEIGLLGFADETVLWRRHANESWQPASARHQ